MSSELKISAGQYSDKGRKDINQDFHGICVPRQPQLSTKGVAVALADGISSSDVSHMASRAAVAGFLEDYFCTSDAWSVKHSAQKVLTAINFWLNAQSQRSAYRYDRDRGYVCTLSAMVIKSMTAHIFHVGDARIYRLRDNALEQLTQDHRLRIAQHTYLGRALGLDSHLEIDYQALPVERGDVFLLATDGVYEYASAGYMIDAVRTHRDDLEGAARAIVDEAYARGSPDNLTAQIVRVEALPAQHADEVMRRLTERPFPPLLDARAVFDGFTIVREVHASSRSHVYLAVDGESGTPVILKTPSIDLQGDPAYLERFLLEEWIAQRIHSAHVVKSQPLARRRNFIYTVTEFIEGQTLTQWMVDHPRPDLETVRGIVEQIAKGLRAFHRLEMLHQDLRPDNILIDRTGTVKIIDFGSTHVAGIAEIATPIERASLLGTAQYAAPEYLLGGSGTTASDIFSLGVIAYQMLSGKLPYGTQVAKCKTRSEQKKLRYESLLDGERAVPAWIDGAIRKAVHPDPHRRYAELSEFVFDLRQPNRAFLDRPHPPLIERNPLVFWQGLSFILAVVLIVLLGTRHAVV
ncbi:MAG: protein kinase domain-containing protein [Hyphomicrobiaceae bacterium]